MYVSVTMYFEDGLWLMSLACDWLPVRDQHKSVVFNVHYVLRGCDAAEIWLMFSIVFYCYCDKNNRLLFTNISTYFLCIFDTG